MGIETASRRYTDNLRRKRRFLQGRGVNLRETIVLSGAVYVDDRIVVPGLHDDDDIVSVLNMTDLVDVTGYLDDAGEFATVAFFGTGNKGVRFTALRAGALGNKLYVKSIAAPGVSLPLSVQIGDYNTLLGIDVAANHGKTLILVNLATDGAGAVLADGSNTAKKVLAAVDVAQEAGFGDAIVDVSLPGTGATEWTAPSGPTALTGGASFKQGPSFASLDENPAGENNSVRYTARAAGADGNSITVDYNLGGALAVAVAGTDIVVTVVTLVTTAQQVIDAVNAKAAASALVIATASPDNDGTGIVAATAQAPLTGGIDPGIQLSEVSDAIKLKVLWLTRDERDEN